MPKIVVTDLTRFESRAIVCLAGLDLNTGACVRPMRNAAPYYLPFDFIKKNKVQPGTVLESNFVNKKSAKPHVEDCQCGEIKVLPAVSGDEFANILQKSAVTSIAAGFGTNPDKRLFSPKAPPPVSIITVRLDNPRNQIRIVADGYEKTRIRAHVTDSKGVDLSWMPITDLGFYDHAAALRKSDESLQKLNDFIHKQKFVMVRLGLSREYENPQKRNGYWVQANGIYTFPDYRTDLRQYD